MRRTALIATLTSLVLMAGVSAAHAAPPANDNIADAQVITGTSGSVSGTTVDATIEPGEDAPVAKDTGLEVATHTVWYRWLPAHAGTVTFSVATDPNLNPMPNPNIFVALGDSIDERFIADNDSNEPPNPGDPLVSVNATAGQAFWIAVGSHNGATFEFALSWTQAVPPGATLRGTNGRDVIKGTPGDDVIYGKAGNDRIIGGGGHDIIIGGPGRDTIDGGFGADRLSGGGGRDRFIAEDGFVDTINGGRGKDRIVSRDANDVTTR